MIDVNDQLTQERNKERHELDAELADKQDSCAKKQAEIAQTMCGIRVVRTGIFRMAGDERMIEDCQVTDWVEEACTKPCEGGEQRLTRQVFLQANEGAGCPPLQMLRKC